MNDSEVKGFLSQFEKAADEIKRLKVSVPHIFPAWAALKHAEQEFEMAKLKLELARQRWEKT